jgi:uncharacterized membrane protein
MVGAVGASERIDRVLKLGPLVLAATAALYSVVRYNHLPEEIPLHWGPGGLGNELARPIGAFVIPAAILGLWLLALQVDRALHDSKVRKAHTG